MGVFGANTLGLTLLAFQIALGLGPAQDSSAGLSTGGGATEEEKEGEEKVGPVAGESSKEKTPQ